MTAALYPKTKAKFLLGNIDLETVDIRAQFLDDTYTYNAAHEFFSSVDSGALVGSPVSLAGVEVDLTTGALKSNNPLFLGVDGDEIDAVLLYVWTGDAATSSLLYFDNENYTGLPFDPADDNLQIEVDPDGWFVL
jgi:hypothetical protein